MLLSRVGLWLRIQDASTDLDAESELYLGGLVQTEAERAWTETKNNFYWEK